MPYTGGPRQVLAGPKPAGLALQRLATILHAEWGDLLFPAGELVDALCGRFYRAVADLVGESTATVLPDASRVCDVGGGLGRLLFELSRRSMGRAELVLAEPAGPLCEWARRLLCGARFDGLAPVVTRAETVEFRSVRPADVPAPLAAAVVRQASAAELTDLDRHFDLVACLNVIDRVARPAALVADLSRLLRHGGVLVLSSPFQFRAELTPHACWLTDLRQVLPYTHWSVVGQAPRVPYEFRVYDRCYVSFASQVVVAVKR